MDFEKIYPHSYSDQQQRKFLDRYGNHWKYRIENCFQHVEGLEGKRVLDLGCSIGTFAIESALRGAEEVIGLDLDHYALKLARENAKNLNLHERCSFFQCDVSELCLKSGTMDVVLAQDIFEHLDDRELRRMLAECRRILKSDGIFVGHTFPTKYESLFNKKSLYPIFLMIYLFSRDPRKHILKLYDEHLEKDHEELIKNSPHCNLLDHVDFLNMIKEAGFKVEFYRTHNLYDFDTKSFSRRLLAKTPESHRHITLRLVNN
jgi:ubiquinone/menaquinone biosynthesis C-methylase UbiE